MNKFQYILLGLALCLATDVYAQESGISQNSTGNTVITPAEPQLNSENNQDFDELKAKADSGDVEAQLDLGYTYLYGVNGTNIDYKQALAYYEMAAKQNNAVAYNNLGSLYFSGIGTDIDYTKAIYFFEEAAKLGSSDAAVNLAIIYLGKDTKNKTDETYKKILDLLEQAQENNSIAKYLLGYCHFRGFLVEQDYIKAFKLIKPIADEQYDEAQLVLADFYINGWGTTKNYNQAISSLQDAVKQGSSAAMIQLADILVAGKIDAQDIKKAHVLYNIASVMGEKGAAEKGESLEENLSIEDLLEIQAEAENYKAVPSDKTTFIRQTFGDSLKSYIDSNIDVEPKKKADMLK